MALLPHWTVISSKGLEATLTLDPAYQGWSLGCGLYFQEDHQYHFFAAKKTTSPRPGIPPTEGAKNLYREAVQQEEESSNWTAHRNRKAGRLVGHRDRQSGRGGEEVNSVDGSTRGLGHLIRALWS